MKIVEITKENDIYTVKQVPNWLERLFGIKEKVEKFKKDNWHKYMFGGGLYYNQKGEEIGNGNKVGLALDNYERSF